MQIEYELTCEPEIESIAGYIDSGEPDLDRRDEETILDQLASGNEWAWCTAKVTARVEIDGDTFTGDAYLGCCSYESEARFREGGYYEDMCDDARADLLASLQSAVKRGQLAANALSALEDKS